MATYLPDRITPALQQDAQPGNNGYNNDYVPLVIDQIGPIDVNGTLFIPMGDQAFFGTVTFYISTDNGLTWAPDSSGVTQGCRNWAADWNPLTGLFTIAYLDSANVGALEAIQVRQYNPTTQTWGANLSAGEDSATILTVRTRPNGDILVGHATGSTGDGSERYVISVFSAGAWTDNDLPPFEPATRMSLSPTMTAQVASTGVLYILTNWITSDGQPGAYYYHRFNAAGAFDVVATFFEIFPAGLFGGNMALNEAENYWAVGWFKSGEPVGSQLYVAKLTGLGAPFLSESNAVVPDSGIDYAAQFVGGTQFSQPIITRAGGFLYLTVIGKDMGGNASLIYTFRALDTDPFGPYTQVLLMDAADTDPAVQFVNDGLVASLPDGNPGLFFNATGAALNNYGRYTLGLPAPPPALPTIKITLRGVKRFRCPDDLKVTDVPGLPSVKRAM